MQNLIPSFPWKRWKHILPSGSLGFVTYQYGFLAVGVLEGPGSSAVLLGKRLRVDVLVQALERVVKVNVLLK